MNKRGGFSFWVSMTALVGLIVAMFFFFALYANPQIESSYNSMGIINPVTGFTIEEASETFNETFIFYLLYSIKAYNLHSPPLSNDNPRIEIMIDDDVYNAEINNGAMSISRGVINGKDIIIKTSSSEVIMMLENKDYIKESFRAGSSVILLVNSKSILLAKGYLNLYRELTGAGITGNLIKIFVG